MSRIGKKPIVIPEGVEVKISDGLIIVKGPKGELSQQINPLIKVEEKDKELIISVANPNDKKNKAFWGLFASLIKNMIVGVSEGFEKKLEVIGVGFKVNLQGDKLTLNVGYSHPIEYVLPKGISADVDKNIITVSGIDKQLLGDVVAKIRKIRKPEPYKGKGIKYVDEVIKRKAGKAAAKGSK